MSYTSQDVQEWLRYFYPIELPAFKDLVADLPPYPVVVNIGAGGGTSGLAIAETRPDLVLVTIDIQDLSSPFGCLEAERQVMAKAGLTHYELGKNWIQICDDSKDVANDWESLSTTWLPSPMVNMVYVDGDHSYEGCAGDITGWLPWLKPGGLMIVHDYAKATFPPGPDGPHPQPWPGVDQAVQELLLDKFPVELQVGSMIAFRTPLPVKKSKPGRKPLAKKGG